MAKILIDIDDKTYGRIFHRDCIGEEYDYEVTRAIVNGTKLPDNATNGDVIKAIYHPYAIKEHAFYVNVYMTEEEYCSGNETKFSTDWWNAPYKAGDINDKL